MIELPKTLTFRTSGIGIDVPYYEAKHNAIFVGDFCTKDKSGQFVTKTSAIFWQETPPVEGYSNYFALFCIGETVFITSGATAFDAPIIGLIANNGEIVYSRHRHDFRSSSDGSVTIDGGRDYVRLIGDNSIRAQQVQLRIVGPIIEVHPYE